MARSEVHSPHIGIGARNDAGQTKGSLRPAIRSLQTAGTGRPRLLPSFLRLASLSVRPRFPAAPRHLPDRTPHRDTARRSGHIWSSPGRAPRGADSGRPNHRNGDSSCAAPAVQDEPAQSSVPAPAGRARISAASRAGRRMANRNSFTDCSTLAGAWRSASGARRPACPPTPGDNLAFP